MKSIGDALLDEIERVSAKLERWRGYSSSPYSSMAIRSSFEPAIATMGVAITAAKHALIIGNPAACIRALADLKEFDSDD